MKTRIFLLLLIVITLIGCNDKMKIFPGTYEAVAIGGTHPVKQDSSYSYKASFAKSTIKLMDLPNGRQRALLSTTLDISDGNWLEEGYFDGHGNFVIGIFNKETLEQKNDTCFYKVTFYSKIKRKYSYFPILVRDLTKSSSRVRRIILLSICLR